MQRYHVGWQVNHLDIAPRYAGVLVGISMTAGYLAGVINPLIVAAIVKDQVCRYSTGCSKKNGPPRVS